MRVIMDYMYKDHLKAKSFCFLPYSLSPEPSAIPYPSCTIYICIQPVSSASSSNQLPKRIKKRNRERRENRIVFLLWIRDYYSIFLISKTAI